MDLLKALEVLALAVHDPGEVEALSALFNRLLGFCRNLMTCNANFLVEVIHKTKCNTL